MAERPKGYGMTADLEAKKAAKHDRELAKEVFEWITHITGEADALPDGYEIKDIHEKLKDGVILCKLMNIILTVVSSPETPIKINTGTKMAFKQMENIGKFLDYCCKLGCKKEDLFQTADLYDCSNIPQVVNGIFALGRKVRLAKIVYTITVNKVCPEYGIGPKESSKNERDFSQEQLDAGKHVLRLQGGTNKGASQSGQNFGLGRQIL